MDAYLISKQDTDKKWINRHFEEKRFFVEIENKWLVYYCLELIILDGI